MQIVKSFVLAAGLSLAAFGALAQEQASKDEAIAMVNAAVAHMQKVGNDKAFADFNDKANADWHKKDLYVTVTRGDGLNLVHGANEKIVGKNIWELKDQNGKLFIQAMVNAAKKAPGWVDYEWSHPVTKKVESKTSYVRWVPSVDAVLSVGAYR